MQRSGGILVGTARGWVRALLLLYPQAFRRRFGADMREDFDERLEERAARGVTPVFLLVAQTTVDVAVAALREWLRPSVPRDVPLPDDHRTLTRGHPMDHLRLDLRFALRSLARRPGFTAIAVITLALGIGANTAIFSVVNAVLLRSLPYLEPNRLTMVWRHHIDDPSDRGSMSGPDIDDVRELDAVTAIEGFGETSTLTLNLSGSPELVSAGSATGGLLAVFGLRPLLGRDLTHEDDLEGAARVVVVSHDFWRTRLGGRPDAIGTTLELSERSYEVVGVAPARFRFPVGGPFGTEGVQLWTAHRRHREGCARDCHILRAIARLAPGVSVERASAGLTTLAASLSDEYPTSNFESALRFEPLGDYVVGDARRPLWIVFGAVGVVLLIACATAFYRQLLEQVGTLPDVRSAGATVAVPLANTIGDWGIDIEGRLEPADDRFFGHLQVVTPGYFEAMGMARIRGRFVDETDRTDGLPSVVISEAMAERYWPGESAIGKRFRISGRDGPWFAVVGVVGDVRHNAVVEEALPVMYFPHAQLPLVLGGVSNMALVIKTASDPLAATEPVREAIRSMDPNLPVSEIRTLEQIVDTAFSEARFATLLLGVFAGVALLLGAVGIYGVIAYMVNRRTNEIGIRMALGARTADVRWLVVRQGAVLALIGIALGLGRRWP